MKQLVVVTLALAAQTASAEPYRPLPRIPPAQVRQRSTVVVPASAGAPAPAATTPAATTPAVTEPVAQARQLPPLQDEFGQSTSEPPKAAVAPGSDSDVRVVVLPKEGAATREAGSRAEVIPVEEPAAPATPDSAAPEDVELIGRDADPALIADASGETRAPTPPAPLKVTMAHGSDGGPFVMVLEEAGTRIELTLDEAGRLLGIRSLSGGTRF